MLPETRCFAFKAALLRWCGARIGTHVRICSSAHIIGNGDLQIGDDVWIGSGVFISTVKGVKVQLGACCDIAPRVSILTGMHKITPDGAHIAGGDGFVGACW